MLKTTKPRPKGPDNPLTALLVRAAALHRACAALSVRGAALVVIDPALPVRGAELHRACAALLVRGAALSAIGPALHRACPALSGRGAARHVIDDQREEPVARGVRRLLRSDRGFR